MGAAIEGIGSNGHAGHGVATGSAACEHPSRRITSRSLGHALAGGPASGAADQALRPGTSRGLTEVFKRLGLHTDLTRRRTCSSHGGQNLKVAATPALTVQGRGPPWPAFPRRTSRRSPSRLATQSRQRVDLEDDVRERLFFVRQADLDGEEITTAHSATRAIVIGQRQGARSPAVEIAGLRAGMAILSRPVSRNGERDPPKRARNRPAWSRAHRKRACRRSARRIERVRGYVIHRPQRHAATSPGRSCARCARITRIRRCSTSAATGRMGDAGRWSTRR